MGQESLFHVVKVVATLAIIIRVLWREFWLSCRHTLCMTKKSATVKAARLLLVFCLCR